MEFKCQAGRAEWLKKSVIFCLTENTICQPAYEVSHYLLLTLLYCQGHLSRRYHYHSMLVFCLFAKRSTINILWLSSSYPSCSRLLTAIVHLMAWIAYPFFPTPSPPNLSTLGLPCVHPSKQQTPLRAPDKVLLLCSSLIVHCIPLHHINIGKYCLKQTF